MNENANDLPLYIKHSGLKQMSNMNSNESITQFKLNRLNIIIKIK